jgi:DNA polymerase I-like protein with 3'-5' exonuclease and polymerase domains
MAHVPVITDLHMLKDSLNVIVKANLPIGRDNRNRPSLFPFGCATGRNAHGRSLFNAHAAMRGFLMFSAAQPGFYLDWSSQEVGIGASLSQDKALMAAYTSGDVYYAFAREIGLTDDPDPKHWKATEEKTRDRIKALYLAITYGMSVASLARSLDRHPLIASGLIQRHQLRYPRYWEWREERLQAAMQDRIIETRYSWPLRISTSPNMRTLINFNSQGNGSECLRLATTRLCNAGRVPCMLVTTRSWWRSTTASGSRR